MDLTTTILMAAKTARVHGALLLAICTHETGLKNSYVANDKGSPTIGICQIKKFTASLVGFKGSSKELMKPDVNAYYSGLYLKYQLERYNNNLCKAIAAYNAGSFIESEKFPTFPKNYKYVKNVRSKANKDLQKQITCGSIFVK